MLNTFGAGNTQFVEELRYPFWVTPTFLKVPDPPHRFQVA